MLAELEELFLAEGFAQFTLDELAGRMRCSKSTLYALAPSKEQLAVKVVGHFFKGAAELIEQRVEGIDDAREIIGEYLAGVSEYLNRASATFMARALAKPAWPLAWVSHTGLFGDTRLSASCSGKPSTFGDGTSDHFS